MSPDPITDEEARELAQRLERESKAKPYKLYLPILDADEREQLFAWVRRRMEREADERRAQRERIALGVPRSGDAARWGRIADDDREALAHAVGVDLARTLCELAMRTKEPRS